MDETQPSGGEISHQDKIAAFNARLLGEQNLLLGILAGLGTAVAGAVLWMGITMATGMIIGFVALAIGAGVGYAVRFAGKGLTKPFGVVGAVCTLLSCLMGQVLIVVMFASQKYNIDFFTALSHVDMETVIDSISDSSPITYLIYGIGIFEGYKFSFRQVTPEELQQAGLR